jgi:FtsP/CotA-like multicopper oxidase with cupredoxin domain
LIDGLPWGKRTAKNTNYYDVDAIPNTGVTRNYDWTISSQSCAPDGVTIDCVLVNGQFPGPLVEANWGDWIEVKVKDNLTELEEGTAIHWHGFLQKGTQYMDGVPGYDQCPIAPGGEFIYRFRASLYGSTWYHSHYSAQYGSGMVGPMVVYGPKNADNFVDIGPVMVMDWYHENYKESIEGLFKPFPNAIVPRADSNTINGKGSYSGVEPPMIPTFDFTSGKTHRLRLINPSSVAVQKITIDNHKFTVTANDFVEIEPYTTDVITLGVGQRSDVLVEAAGDSTDVIYLRAYRPADCALSNGNEEMKATICYEDADRSELPILSAGPNAYDNSCSNDDLSLTKPYYPMKAEDASVTEILPIELKSNGSHLIWY